jgi:hypothetical protein
MFAEAAISKGLVTELTRIASAVREILEEYAESHGEDIMFQCFPRGTCGPVAELLGRYLLEAVRMNARYVCAARGAFDSAIRRFESSRPSQTTVH